MVFPIMQVDEIDFLYDEKCEEGREQSFIKAQKRREGEKERGYEEII